MLEYPEHPWEEVVSTFTSTHDVFVYEDYLAGKFRIIREERHEIGHQWYVIRVCDITIDTKLPITEDMPRELMYDD